MNDRASDRVSPRAPLPCRVGPACLDHPIGMSTILIFGLLPSWLGLVGGAHWALDLFSHFRWQYLVFCVAAVVWAARRRQRLIGIVSAVTLLLNAWLIGRLAWQPDVRRDRLADDFSLRVLSMNVLTSNRERGKVIEHVLSSNAEIVFLMEVNHRWMAELSALNAKYPHRIALPQEDNFGVALFSKIPWARQELLWLGQADVPSIEIALTHQGRDLVFIGTHPLPPVGSSNARLRNEQLQDLAHHVDQMKSPALVVGDLNATPWSEGMRIATSNGYQAFRARGRLGFRSLSPPWTPTWRTGSVFAIPIDQALCTAPLAITGRSVGPDVGSDHRPLTITVGWER